MREIKLSGREIVVVRALGFALGQTGTELIDNTKLEAEQLTDVLNGLLSAGYVEAMPYTESVAPEALAKYTFETNPSFAQELKRAMGRGRDR
ncbi:MAG: hypothetical protein JSR82_20770 [Verrucomicrobia bacterium]|nr:hypothetical protein [Verrucomicrobiota bacterium]